MVFQLPLDGQQGTPKLSGIARSDLFFLMSLWVHWAFPGLAPPCAARGTGQHLSPLPH